MFPLNATFNIREINGRVEAELGGEEKVSLVPGPDGRLGGSYKLERKSHITFPSNQEDGTLDARYSMTILFWLYYAGQEGNNGSIVRYVKKNRTPGTGMFLSGRNDLQARIETRDHARVYTLEAPILTTLTRDIQSES